MSYLDPTHLTILGSGTLARGLTQTLLQSAAEIKIHTHNQVNNHPNVIQHTSIKEAVTDVGTVIFAVSACDLERLVDTFSPFALGDQILITVSKGIIDPWRLPHQVLRTKTCARKIGILGGPLHIKEALKGHRMHAVVASHYHEVFERVSQLTQGLLLSFQFTNDTIGVEMAGAISKVATIAAGMADGLNWDATTRGMLILHGIREARRLGLALGAKEVTFSGLAGVGELIPGSYQAENKHYQFGRDFVQGWHEKLPNLEGIATAYATHAKSSELGIGLPLVSSVLDIINRQQEASVALERILARTLPL